MRIPTSLAAVSLLLAVAGVASSPAAADELDPALKGPGCAMVLGPIDVETGGNSVLSYECADDASELRVPEGSTLLVRLYSEANFNPQWWQPFTATLSISGGAGPCDWAGYMVNDLGAWMASNGRKWRYVLSSYKVFNNCNYTETFTGPYKSGWWSPLHYGNVGYVGDVWNDNTGSIRLRA